MKQKTFSGAVAVIFVAIALLHALRIVAGWEAALGGWMVPVWLSYVAVVVGVYLGYHGWRLHK